MDTVKKNTQELHHTYQHSHDWFMFCVPLKSNLSFAQISKNKPTNPSPYLHADVHLPEKEPRAPEPTVVPATTIIPPEYPASKKRLLIRVEVEAGKVVSESSHYTEDWLTLPITPLYSALIRKMWIKIIEINLN